MVDALSTNGHSQEFNPPAAPRLTAVNPEQAVLGALLIDDHAISQVAEILEPSDFFLPAHQLIYAAMLRLKDRRMVTDLVLVDTELNGDGDAAGGVEYLATLATQTPSSLHAVHYAEQVRQAAQERRWMALGTELAAGGLNGHTVSRVEAFLADVRGRERAEPWEAKAMSLQRLYDRITGPQGADDAGIPTGISQLDRLIGGMRRGDLIICGARPSVGKTSFSVTIAHHVGVELSRPVLFLSLEMLRDRIWEKLIAIDAGIPWITLDRHAMNEQQMQSAAESLGRIQAAPFDVVPAREWSVERIRTAAREAHAKQPLSLVVVDYLQLATVEGRRENRTQEVSAISQQLKHMALELECPVLALSQLKRESDLRPNADPVMSELKESGSIEQEADVVILLSRTKEERAPDHRPPVQKIVTQVAKNRLGETGKTVLGLRGAYMQFVSAPLDESRAAGIGRFFGAREDD